MDIERILSEFKIKAKKSGKSFVVKCPFHKETHPSLHIYEDGHFHCYGCGAHGDIAKLISAIKKVPIEEVLVHLASVTGEDPGKYEDYVEIRKTLDAYVNWGIKQWDNAPEWAWGYMRSKFGAATEKVIKEYKIGYHPKGRNKKSPKIDKAGMKNIIYAGSSCGGVIIPILVHGRVTRVSMRVANGCGKFSKYIHSANTVVSPRKELYGVFRPPKDEIIVPIIVEGVFDAIALQLHGLTAFASLGLSMSESQARKLKGFREVVLMPDGDVYKDKKKLRDVVSNAILLGKFGIRPMIYKIDGDPDEFIGEFEGENIFADKSRLFPFHAFVAKHFLKISAIKILTSAVKDFSPEVAVEIIDYLQFKWGVKLDGWIPKKSADDPRIMFLVARKVANIRGDFQGEVELPESVRDYMEEIDPGDIPQELANRLELAYNHFMDLPPERLRDIIENMRILLE